MKAVRPYQMQACICCRTGAADIAGIKRYARLMQYYIHVIIPRVCNVEKKHLRSA